MAKSAEPPAVECSSCGLEYRPGKDPDPCLGTLPGVTEACCGHGDSRRGYLMLEDGTLFRGFRKIEWHDLTRKGKARGQAR